jgi:hypothetical protein
MRERLQACNAKANKRLCQRILKRATAVVVITWKSFGFKKN